MWLILPMISEVEHAQLPLLRELFLEYAQSLDFDLSFQGFTEELENLPGEYASPRGVILLATATGVAAGCVALRPLEQHICEMKRLYVRPSFQGQGIGRQLAEAVIQAARKRNYKKMRLDTVPSMVSAISMYKSLGFNLIPAYRVNPIPGTSYMEKTLAK